MNIKTYFGFKKQQTQTFSDKGKRYVVTKIEAMPLIVKRIKKFKQDGYFAYQVAVKKAKKQRKPFLREIKFEKEPELKLNDQIKAEQVLKKDDKVKVTGITKGKGFAGAMKRWGFKGGPRTHGQSDRQRAPGSIGQGTDPGRVWKGKKMPGRMGGVTKTIKGLKIFKIDQENEEIWITGVVPGPKGSLIKITKTKET
jgi:large subunit ribosomal protein L3